MSNRYLDWLRQAERDLEHARFSLKRGDYEWACFAAQQVAEKAVKALHLFLGQEARELRELPIPVSEILIEKGKVLDGFPEGAPSNISVFVYTAEEFAKLKGRFSRVLREEVVWIVG